LQNCGDTAEIEQAKSSFTAATFPRVSLKRARRAPRGDFADVYAERLCKYEKKQSLRFDRAKGCPRERNHLVATILILNCTSLHKHSAAIDLDVGSKHLLGRQRRDVSLQKQKCEHA
jgi:hypothetical protein